jgi:hypothetical protein
LSGKIFVYTSGLNLDNNLTLKNVL